MITYYYLIAVVESLHWMSAFVAAAAFVSMIASKISQVERESTLSRQVREEIKEEFKKRADFRKTCIRYVAFFGVITILTPPLTQMLEAKVNAAALLRK